jgi:hypothetical protein
MISVALIKICSCTDVESARFESEDIEPTATGFTLIKDWPFDKTFARSFDWLKTSSGSAQGHFAA